MPERPATYRDIVENEAKKYNIPSPLAFAMIDQESGGKVDRWSEEAQPNGDRAYGLFQLMPATAKSLGIDREDPVQNIQGGLKYLRQQLDASQGDVAKALALYHGGPDLRQHGPKTHAYVQGILGRLQQTAPAGAGSQPEHSKAGQPPVVPPPDPNSLEGILASRTGGPGGPGGGGATTPPPRGPASRFFTGLWDYNPVTGPAKLAYGLATTPKQTIDETLFNPIARQGALAKSALEETPPRPGAALGHAAAMTPLIGPAIANIVETAQSGDWAGAAGQATGAAITAGATRPVGRTAAAVGRNLPGVSQAMEAAGNVAERVSTREMTQAITPKGGANRPNFTALANRIAPELARDPALRGTWTRGGVGSAIDTALDGARSTLDDVLDTKLLQTMHDTDPIIQGLQKEQGKLVRRGSSGAKVVSPENQAAFDVYEQMINDIKSMGSRADYENLRGVRQDWDKTAMNRGKIYARSAADLGTKSEGEAFANGAGVVRDYLAAKEPAAARANAQYALYRNAQRVFRAMEENETTRQPSLGRAIVTRGTGFVLGRELGGVTGEIVGSVLAPVLDRALSSPRAGFQVKMAQQFAALADALKGGNPTKVQAAVKSLSDYVPPMKTATTIARFAEAGKAPLKRAAEGPPEKKQEERRAAEPPPVAPPASSAATPPPEPGLGPLEAILADREVAGR